MKMLSKIIGHFNFHSTPSIKKKRGQAQEDAARLLQSGIYTEEVQGDLEKALTFYQKNHRISSATINCREAAATNRLLL